MTGRIAVLAVVLLATSVPATAQAVKVEFLMGKVNITAQNASLRAILNEWSRVGGMRLINPERLTGAPLTLELVGVPERQALDILMREVGGYILGPRMTTLVAGVSAFDRLVVVSGVAGRPSAPAPGFPAPRPAAALGRVVTPIEREPDVTPGIVDVDDDDDDDSEPDTPEDRAPGRVRPNAIPPLGSGLPPLPRTEPQPESRPAPTPGNPFGQVQGASRPGSIAPVPQPEPQSERIQTRPPDQ
jgi:hypothetical protein